MNNLWHFFWYKFNSLTTYVSNIYEGLQRANKN